MTYTMKLLEDFHDGRPDYALLHEGKIVGRCYRMIHGWFHWTVYHQPPIRTFGDIVANGDCDGIEQAQAQFKSAYEAIRALNGCPIDKPEASSHPNINPHGRFFYSG